MQFANMLSSATEPHIVSVGDALLIALIGVSIVFVVLVVLMFCIQLAGKIIAKSPEFAKKHPGLVNKVAQIKASVAPKKEVEFAGAVSEISATAPEIKPEYASGSCGSLTLIKTEERDAAMIMAIVADAMETPLNELRFQSIKRIV